jgi:hypothetical protein
VVLGVLREIAHGHGFLDLGGKLVLELVLENFDLCEKLFFDVLRHSYSMARRVALSARDKELDF